MGMVQFRAPALPLPGETYNQRQADELLRALRIYFNQLDSLTPNQAQSYAAGCILWRGVLGISV
jgi:hypothetical protein